MTMAALPIKFTCLLLFLLFISAWFSSANAHPTAVEVDNSSSERIAVDGDGMATTSIEMIGGRKALGAHSIKRPDIKGNAAVPAGTSSANDRVAGKYGYEREVMDIGNKRNGGRFSEEMKESGFVAFNADYHEPRHHPPKNN
ncbi:ROOT MERISTEM GROWTH FACTOR 2 [Salix purpurea]|uniref:ROOT MERISTEM GROWTH FACTOR 2 n=1 Tax=Salix purpurea TaxID=77065 RepID=A0A9Q0UAE8_SALPP|nr:ROOT MERISTEM GROWTH FACTOR 2 [Salix purpurea]